MEQWNLYALGVFRLWERVRMGKLPLFLETPAKCEVRGGTVHFIWDEIDLALPISVCMANMRACQRALDEWQTGEVVPIRRRKDAKPAHH